MANSTELKLIAHKSHGYMARTCHNAAEAELTAAFALNFETAGERLTRRMAGPRYVAIPFDSAPLDAARILYRALKTHNARTLNVAGNGLQTLSRSGWTQAQCNQFLYEVLSMVQPHWKLERVISGGQTGTDVAGGVAAAVLGIDVVMTFPAGFVQRGVDGVDRVHSEQQIMADVERMIDGLRDAQAQLQHRILSEASSDERHDDVSSPTPRGG